MWDLVEMEGGKFIEKGVKNRKKMRTWKHCVHEIVNLDLIILNTI